MKEMMVTLALKREKKNSLIDLTPKFCVRGCIKKVVQVQQSPRVDKMRRERKEEREGERGWKNV